MKILIAEDEPISAALLRSHLSKWGFDVVATTDGVAAWNALVAEDAPKIAILDWMMPGLEGPEVLRRLRAEPRTASTYVILLTGKNAQEDLIRGFEAGADDYVVKPFPREELRVRVNVGVRIVELQEKLRERVAELEVALSKVRTLSGLLPMCSYCKRIRDDSDYWTEVESYFARFSSAEFSHGVCPTCYDTHMRPKLEEMKRERDRRLSEEAARAESGEIR